MGDQMILHGSDVTRIPKVNYDNALDWRDISYRANGITTVIMIIIAITIPIAYYLNPYVLSYLPLVLVTYIPPILLPILHIFLCIMASYCSILSTITNNCICPRYTRQYSMIIIKSQYIYFNSYRYIIYDNHRYT